MIYFGMDNAKEFYAYAVKNYLTGKPFYDACLEVKGVSIFWQRSCDVLCAWEGEHLEILKAKYSKLVDYHASYLKHKLRYELGLSQEIIQQLDNVLDGISDAKKDFLVKQELVDRIQHQEVMKSASTPSDDSADIDVDKISRNLKKISDDIDDQLDLLGNQQDLASMELQDGSLYIMPPQPTYNPVWSSVLSHSSSKSAKWISRGILIFMFIVMPSIVIFCSKQEVIDQSPDVEQTTENSTAEEVLSSSFTDAYCGRYMNSDDNHIDSFDFAVESVKELYNGLLPGSYDPSCNEYCKSNECLHPPYLHSPDDIIAR